jgi:hypothetical protein
LDKKEEKLKALFTTFLLFTFAISIKSANASPLEKQWDELGTVAGLGFACKSPKLDEYEVIVSALIRAKTKSDAQEESALITYSKAKLKSYRRHKKYPKMECNEINLRFSKQRIFDSKMLVNGSIKTPEGEWLYPRRPFPAIKSKKINGQNKAPMPRFKKTKKPSLIENEPTIRHISNKKR